MLAPVVTHKGRSSPGASAGSVPKVPGRRYESTRLCLDNKLISSHGIISVCRMREDCIIRQVENNDTTQETLSVTLS